MEYDKEYKPAVGLSFQDISRDEASVWADKVRRHLNFMLESAVKGSRMVGCYQVLRDGHTPCLDCEEARGEQRR